MFLILISTLALSLNIAHAELFTRKVFAMGTELEVTLKDISRDQALLLSEDILKIVQNTEKRLSTWRSDSELSQLNSSKANSPFTASNELSMDLKKAFECEIETDGAFNPALAPLVGAWGLRVGGHVPNKTELKMAKENSGTQLFKVEYARDSNQKSIFTKITNRAGIEEGGFGKGAALDEAIQFLKTQSPMEATLNFGGQIAFIGKSKKTVAIADPSDRSKTILTFETDSPSVATSGNSVHHNTVKKNGKKITIGHLINPRTGIPVNDEGSITLLESSAFKADCKSKVFTLGRKNALNWADQHQVKILWLSRPSKKEPWTAHTSCAWNELISSKNINIKIISSCKKEREKKS